MTYLHIWPPEPLVPTWNWHSVRTSEAPESYGPTTERERVVHVSEDVSAHVGGAIMNEAVEDLLL